MSDNKYLIVNADDFGMSPGVNRGVIKAYEQGIVTSASLMIRWESSKEAAGFARENENLSLGLHIDLAEWAFRNGSWIPLYEVVPLDKYESVRDEVLRQMEAFQNLMQQYPSHLDSHQHIHLHEPLKSIVVEISHNIGVPLRHLSPDVSYCGEFYGQTATGEPLMNAISLTRLINILETIPPGITELACHPADGEDFDGMYRSERKREVEVLCDPAVRDALSELNIELRSFKEITATRREKGA